MPSLGDLIAPRRLGRDFRWLLASSWTSNLGDGIALSAAPLLIASMTSSPILVASGAMMQFLPWLLFGLLAGSVADHQDRRRLVMLADGLRAVIVLALVVFLVTGTATVWIVLATAFLYGTAEVFADSAGSTLLPMLVRPADLGIGNARMQAGYLVGESARRAAAGRLPLRDRIGLAVPRADPLRGARGHPHLEDRPHADPGTAHPLPRARSRIRSARACAGCVTTLPCERSCSSSSSSTSRGRRRGASWSCTPPSISAWAQSGTAP